LLKSEELTAEDVYRAGIKADELHWSLSAHGRLSGYRPRKSNQYSQSEMIVIGGGVVNGVELFAKHVQREIAERAFRACGGS